MYVLNHTNTNLNVGTYVEIPPGRYLKVDKFVAESSEVAYAVRAKWASLHDSPPKEVVFEEPEVKFVEGAYVEPEVTEAPVESVDTVEETPESQDSAAKPARTRKTSK